MAIKFYMDEHVHPGIAKALERHGIDVLTAQQAGMLGDYLDKRWTGKIKHSGIVYAYQSTTMRQTIDGLILIYEAITEEEMKNHVEYV